MVWLARIQSWHSLILMDSGNSRDAIPIRLGLLQIRYYFPRIFRVDIFHFGFII